MCKLIKWNPSLRLAILPSIRYFKIERENFRVPHRGLAGKKLFTNYNAVSSPRRVIYDFSFVFSLFHYYFKSKPTKGKRNIWSSASLCKDKVLDTVFKTLLLRGQSWQQIQSSTTLQSPVRTSVDRLLSVFLGLLNSSKRALFSTILRQMTFFCKQRRTPHPHQKGLQDLASATNRNTSL